jgi:hypothetical protein
MHYSSARRSLALLLALLSLSCQREVSVEQPERLSDAEKASRDAAVLEVLLLDVLTMPESPVEPSGAATKRLLFSTDPSVSKIGTSEILEFDDREAFARLSKTQLARVREAAEQLVERVNRNDGVKTFTPKDARLHLYTRQEEELQRKSTVGFGPQVFRCVGPGYSHDGRVAIVCLSFGWSIHSGRGTYILTKTGSDWTVLLKDFQFFV